MSDIGPYSLGIARTFEEPCSDTAPVARPVGAAPSSGPLGVALPVVTALLAICAVSAALGTLWYLPAAEARAPELGRLRGLLLGGAWLALGALGVAGSPRLGGRRYRAATLLAGLSAAAILGAGLWEGIGAARDPAGARSGVPPWLAVALYGYGALCLAGARRSPGRWHQLALLAGGAAVALGALACWQRLPLPVLAGMIPGLAALVGLALRPAVAPPRPIAVALGLGALAAAVGPAARLGSIDLGIPGACGPVALGLAAATLGLVAGAAAFSLVRERTVR